MGKVKIAGQIYNIQGRVANNDAAWGPWASIDEAVAKLTELGQVVVGKTVGIKQTNGSILEYWVQPTSTGVGLVEKGAQTGASGTVYTKGETNTLLAEKLPALVSNIRGVFAKTADASDLQDELEESYEAGDTTVNGSQILIIDPEVATSGDSMKVITFDEDEDGYWKSEVVAMNIRPVTITPTYTASDGGDQIATFTFNGVQYNLYAPPTNVVGAISLDTSFDSNPQNTRVPSTKLVKDQLDLKADKTQVTQLSSKVGDLSNLNTDDVSSLVNAINEVLSKIGSGGSGSGSSSGGGSVQVVNNLSSTSTTAALSANMGKSLNDAISALQNLIGTKEQLQISNVTDIVDAINKVKALVDALAPADNLTSDSTTKPLSAKQGKALKALIDDISGKLGDLGDMPVADAIGAINDTIGDAESMVQAHGSIVGAIDSVEGRVASLEQNGGGSSSGGGSASGTTNYNELTNKPSINGVSLVGNKTLADLGINQTDEEGNMIYGSMLVETGLKPVGFELSVPSHMKGTRTNENSFMFQSLTNSTGAVSSAGYLAIEFPELNPEKTYVVELDVCISCYNLVNSSSVVYEPWWTMGDIVEISGSTNHGGFQIKTEYWGNTSPCKMYRHFSFEISAFDSTADVKYLHGSLSFYRGWVTMAFNNIKIYEKVENVTIKTKIDEVEQKLQCNSIAKDVAKYYYSGEKISLKKHTMGVQLWDRQSFVAKTYPGGADSFGGYMCFMETGASSSTGDYRRLVLYDIATKTIVGSVPSGITSTKNIYHSNCCSFTNYRYDPSDYFPLFMTSSCFSTRVALGHDETHTDEDGRTLLDFWRLQLVDGAFSATRVKRINIQGRAAKDNSLCGWFQSIFDKETNNVILFGTKLTDFATDGGVGHMVHYYGAKFNLLNHFQKYGSDVVDVDLDESIGNIDFSYSVNNEAYQSGQDLCVCNGLMFMVTGYPSQANGSRIMAINFDGKIVSEINLEHVGVATRKTFTSAYTSSSPSESAKFESEGIFVHDGALFILYTQGLLKFDFE